MGAQSKRAKKIRKASEFDIERLRNALSLPPGSGVPLTSWTLEQIFGARDDQMRGQFSRPAKMAEAMRTDDALAVAIENRLAPLRCTKVEMKPAKSDRGGKISGEAAALFGQSGVGLNPDTHASIHKCLVDHDIAVAQCVPTTREDGSRTDLEIRAWPLEHVRWDAYTRQLMTRIDPRSNVDGVAGEIPIVHGDGRWLVFQRYEIEPWKNATLLSAAPVWARHAYAARDWAKGSLAQGSVKMIGQLPAGVPLQEDGTTSPEAAAMLEIMRDLISADSPAAMIPAGAKAEFASNTSTNWQIFSELILNAERAAARIYLGTDGVLGAQGGAPGVDIQSLFGLAATKVESDVACLARGFQTAIDVWCAINFGDSSLAPTRRYLLPDADADAARASDKVRTDAFYDEIDRAKSSGFAITPEFVEKTAKKHGIEAPPLAAAPAQGQGTQAPASAPALRRVAR
jgi:hypothetical protein